MKRYIQDLEITSYRGIQNLRLENLNQINVLTGDNNSGKTSVLEVLSSLENPLSLEGWKNALRMCPWIRNELTYFESLQLLFPSHCDEISYSWNGKTKRIRIEKKEEEVELSTREIGEMNHRKDFHPYEEGKNELELVQKMELSFWENDSLEKKESIYEFTRQRYVKVKEEKESKIVYVTPFQHIKESIYLDSIFDNSEVYDQMIEILQEFDPAIVSINASRVNHSIVYKILSKEKSLPLNVYGEGMKKAILLLSAVIRAKDGILLVDEFETAIHTSIMEKIFAWILRTCLKLNVQLFLTTHSQEALEKILNCSPELQEYIHLYTVYRKDEQTVARRLTAKKALEVHQDFGLELR